MMYKRKTKVLIAIIVFVSIILLIGGALLIYYGIFELPPSTKRHMKEYLENDTNYVAVQGTVDKVFADEGIIYFSEIQCDEFFYTYSIGYRIYARDIEKILAELNLKKGDVIDFLSANNIFYQGYKYPIVELKKDGIEIISFEEGKAVLLEWVYSL